MIRNQYVSILGWMVSDLKLSGNDLICYALIYGFSQDGETEFKGSLSYIAEWLNTSRQTARLVVKRLVESGLVNKRDEVINGVKFCRYYVSNTGCGENHHRGVVKTTTNIILDNIGINTKSTNVDYSIATHEESVLFPVEKKPLASEIFGFTAKALDVTKKVIERTDSFFDQLTFPFESEEFKKAFYVLMTQPKWRVKTKTLTAMQANLNEIAQFEEGFAMLLINQSISKGWASLVYESTPKQYMQWLREKTGVSGNTQSANNTKSYFQSDEQRRMYQSYLTEDFT